MSAYEDPFITMCMRACTYQQMCTFVPTKNHLNKRLLEFPQHSPAVTGNFR